MRRKAVALTSSWPIFTTDRGMFVMWIGGYEIFILAIKSPASQELSFSMRIPFPKIVCEAGRATNSNSKRRTDHAVPSAQYRPVFPNSPMRFQQPSKIPMPHSQSVISQERAFTSNVARSGTSEGCVT